VAVFCEFLANAIDIILQRLGFVNLVLLVDHLLVVLAADGDFLAFRHHHKIALSGHRILGATGQQRKGKADNQKTHVSSCSMF